MYSLCMYHIQENINVLFVNTQRTVEQQALVDPNLSTQGLDKVKSILATLIYTRIN